MSARSALLHVLAVAVAATAAAAAGAAGAADAASADTAADAASADAAAAAAAAAADARARGDAWADSRFDKFDNLHAIDAQTLAEWPGLAGRGLAIDSGGGGAAARELACTYAPASGVCGPATSCTTSGSAAYTTRSLVYAPTTGIFSGSITTNQCPHTIAESTFKGVVRDVRPALTCARQCYPQVTTTPAAAPLRGAVGFTINGGMNVYNALDAGFFPSSMNPNICSAPYSALGICPPGTDVEMCYAALEVSCGSAATAVTGFATACGNHASPSHYHTLLACDYDSLNSAPHSPLVAVTKDGRGLYGMWEGGGEKPVLDACNGHFGPTPDVWLNLSSNSFGDSFYTGSRGADVYHYHVSSTAPFTIGCYGPVTSLAQAKALYPSCGAAPSAACPACGLDTNISTSTSAKPGSIYRTCTSRGFTEYQLDCPVYRHMYNNGSVETTSAIVPTADCPVCAGSCVSRGMTSGTASASPLPSALATATRSAAAATATRSVQASSSAPAGASPSGTLPPPSASTSLAPSAAASGTPAPPSSSPLATASAAASGAPPGASASGTPATSSAAGAMSSASPSGVPGASPLDTAVGVQNGAGASAAASVSTGAIVGGVLGGAVALAAIIAGVVVHVRSTRASQVRMKRKVGSVTRMNPMSRGDSRAGF